MIKARNDDIRDTVVALCGMGIDHYQVIDTINDTIVAVVRVRDVASTICDQLNNLEDTKKYKVAFINN